VIKHFSVIKDLGVIKEFGRVPARRCSPG